LPAQLFLEALEDETLASTAIPIDQDEAGDSGQGEDGVVDGQEREQ